MCSRGLESCSAGGREECLFLLNCLELQRQRGSPEVHPPLCCLALEGKHLPVENVPQFQVLAERVPGMAHGLEVLA